MPSQDGQTAPRLEFLPLGNGRRVKDSAGLLGRKLPEQVEIAYNALERIMNEEEKVDWSVVDPMTRFEALPVPPSPTPTRKGDGEEDIQTGGNGVTPVPEVAGIPTTTVYDASRDPRRRNTNKPN